MPIIKKAKTFADKGNLIVLTDDISGKLHFSFSELELAYLLEEANKYEKKLIHINRFSQHIFVVLLEKEKKVALQKEALRRAGNTIALTLNTYRAQSVSINDLCNKAEFGLAIAEGIALSSYQFIYHKTTKNKEKNTLMEIHLKSESKEGDIIELNHVIEATFLARDMVNEPVNILNATALSKNFQKLGTKAGIKVEVLGKSRIEQLKMGGLLAVNKGSVDPPTFTIMEYKPKNATNKQPYVLVGKGVVYDTGGLSLKTTTNSMDMMKSDMAGAAAVACGLYAIAKAKIPVHIIALIPATDNRPGGNAFAPGDIITMYDGTTVEMMNSDAEGRMILADALAYAKKYKPCLTIELSTLTGSAYASVGQFGVVSMGTADDKTHQQLKNSGENTHERLVEFPFWEEYEELLKSDIADIKSIGGPFGGAITAGKFLGKFIKYPFIHLDIAGMAFIPSRDHYKPKGGTGVGVRLLFDFFKNL